MTILKQKNGTLTDELIVFTHTVCTGGTTFSDVLDLYFWQGNIIVARNVADQLVDPTLNTALKRRDERNKRIIRQYNQKKDKIKLIRGHHHLAYDRKEIWGNRPVKYLTFLRHPVKRFISHGHYLITNLETLEQLTKIPEIDFNHQTTYLSGCNTLCATERDLEIAKKHLEKYTFIGITERFDESIQLFCKMFSQPYVGWKNNQNHATTVKHFIPQDVKERIKQLSYLDMELYQYGMKLFEKKLEEYENVRLRYPTKKEESLFLLRKMDQYRAKGLRYIQGKLRKNINQQSKLVEFLVN